MWISKHASEMIQRATCRFKPNVYFMKTNAPFSSILFLLPSRSNRLGQLFNRLSNQEHFSLSEQLKTIKVEPLA